MKAIIIILTVTIFSSLLSAEVRVPKKDPHLCKIFQDKATKYKKTMRSDEYAMRTLMSYEKRAKIYCPDK